MNEAGIRKRRARERRFLFLSAGCAAIAIFALAGLLASVALQGWRGFFSASLRVVLHLDAEVVGEKGEGDALAYRRLIKRAIAERFADAPRGDKRKLIGLFSFSSAVQLRDIARANPERIHGRVTVWLPASAKAEAFLKGGDDDGNGNAWRLMPYLEKMRDDGDARVEWNSALFTNADSRDPESAGLAGALAGTALTLLLAFLLSFPAGVLAALYLEFFARRGRLFSLVEVNINNLAAVPSVIFGVLGLAVFINWFGMPRGSPLVGGLVLSLMTLPTIIIASRAALQAQPAAQAEAAMSLGATKMQAVFHHTLPSAMPGVLTGAILGMAQALGETAPLLIIGMVAFVAEAPSGFADAATALPVQIFLWADSPEAGFAERTASAILVLLFFLVLMNAAAVLLRQRLETARG